MKLLKFLWIVQEIPNPGKKLGRGFLTARRFNPYNPLTYLFLLVMLVVLLVCFGLVGMWSKIDTKYNPLKWD